MGKAKLREVQVWGKERRAALFAFKRHVAEWGLVMPDVKPLVLDFGLGEFDKTGLIELWVANETDAGYCGKFLFVFDRQECPYHHHLMKHETFFVMKGAVVMKVKGRNRVLEQGDLLTMPPGTKHSFRGRGPALLLEVSQPSVRGDNFFRNKRIGREGVI